MHYFVFTAPSGPPQGVSAIALGPRIIQINWSQPLPEEQNGIVQSYTVNITVAETGQHIQLTTNHTTITAEGLHPYYNYHISVAAVTIAIGPYTEIYSLQTPHDGKQMKAFLHLASLQIYRCRRNIHKHFCTCAYILYPSVKICITSLFAVVPSGIPTNVRGIAISSTSIKLTWEPPQPEDQNGIIQAYNITITEVLTGRMMYFREGGMDSLLIVNFLHPYYTYQCSISAETIGPGPAANISVTTRQGGMPQWLQLVSKSMDEVSVKWIKIFADACT